MILLQSLEQNLTVSVKNTKYQKTVEKGIKSTEKTPKTKIEEIAEDVTKKKELAKKALCIKYGQLKINQSHIKEQGSILLRRKET